MTYSSYLQGMESAARTRVVRGAVALRERSRAAAGCLRMWAAHARGSLGGVRRPMAVALLIAAAVAPAAVLVQSAAEAHAGNIALWSRAEAFAAECRRIEEQRARLCAETWALDHDPYYLERRIRLDWKVVENGEIVLERIRPSAPVVDPVIR